MIIDSSVVTSYLLHVLAFVIHDKLASWIVLVITRRYGILVLD